VPVLKSQARRDLRLKKILFVATVAEHFNFFYLPYFKLFHEKGWQVDSVCSSCEVMPNCSNCYGISITRSPFNPNNLHALKQITKIINHGNYDIVHCNTPMGGTLARIAARRARKLGTKVIYTAHGFHFFAGAPLLNWLIYFPVERFLSRFTDCLITINREDYLTAKNFFKAGEIVHVHGVGYDGKKFIRPSLVKKSKLRKKYGYADDELLLVYVAELNENKNQKMLISALETIIKNNAKTKLLLVGPDRMKGRYHALVKEFELENHVDFLGQRNDVCEILPMCDLAVASSYREGLPVNIMESLACGLPVIASDNRGHRELVRNGENGYLIKPDDHRALAQKVVEITGNKDLYNRLSGNACASVSLYCSDCVLEEMKAVYGEM
jgi:glycosyltransferase EpsD